MNEQAGAATIAAPAASVRMRFQVMALLVTRTAFNTAFRMIYPFLPVIARGLGVSLEQVTLGITARSLLGLLSPFFGSIADSRGRKFAMVVGVLAFIAGMMVVAIWPTYPALVVALLLTALSKIIFDPAMYAYLGDRVPYQQRGRIAGILEFSWSGAFLLGVPVAAWLIERAGWSAPFPLLGLIGIGAGILLWRMLPADSVHPHVRSSLRAGLKIVLASRPALAAIAISICISASNEVINIIYGAWMENSFQLDVTALGLASAVIGIAELSGEGGVAGLVDRLGKRRALVFGIGLYTITCLLLPILGQSLNGALFGLFLFYLTFEFSVVATIPLVTELTPEARGTLMAGNAAGSSVGRVIGSLIGPLLFTYGLQVNAVFGVVCNLIALALLILFVRERHDTTS